MPKRRLDTTPPARREPTPNPYSLYPTHLRAAMPNPSEQVKDSLAVQLTRAEKETLDLLAAWPLCTTDQLAGLMGGVTRRRTNQVLRSLTGPLTGPTPRTSVHVLRDEGLRYLAHRDRSAVRIAPGPLERPAGRRSPQGKGPGLYRHRPPQSGLPTGTPGRHQYRRRRPERGGRPVQRPLPAGATAHIPFQHRLPLPGRRLRDPSRRHLLDVLSGRLAPLLPGVRAPGRHPQAGPGPAEELSPLLRQRLGPTWTTRGTAAPGTVSCSRPTTPRNPSCWRQEPTGCPSAHPTWK